MTKNIDAILACRVRGDRLYGKPLQTLVPGGITVIECLIEYLKSIKSIRKIILAISEGKENYDFIKLSEKLGLSYVIGDRSDVLQRILDSCCQEGSENVFRATTESPFLLYEFADETIREFLDGEYDYASYEDYPDGTGFELVSVQALQYSHDYGSESNRSELVTSYIAENQNKFRLLMGKLPKYLQRPEVRLTVDYAEDLVFCQNVYKKLKRDKRLISVKEIIKFWDDNPILRKPVESIGIDWGTGRLIWTESDRSRVES